MGERIDGYGATVFIYRNEGVVVKKYLKERYKDYPMDITASEVYHKQIDKINRLNKIQNEHIITPKILETDNKDLSYKQRFIEGERFYIHLLKNCNLFYFNQRLKKLFYQLGKFLGEFHRNEKIDEDEEGHPISHLHADLNNKNILFTQDEKLFIFDPGAVNGTIYKDIATFLKNLCVINPLIKPFLSKKKLKQLEKVFIQGYEKKGFKLNKEKLNEQLLDILKKDRERIINQGVFYNIRKTLLNWENKKVYKEILS